MNKCIVLILFALLLFGENTGNAAQTQVLKSTARPKVGLALGGGGARGIAHIGVIKVLERNGIPIDCIAGTSMGAIVGGLYSSGVSVNSLENRFIGCKLVHAFMTVPLSVRVTASPVLLSSRLFHHPYDGLYKGNKFRKYLDEWIPKNAADFKDLKIPFHAIATNLIDGKAYALSNGRLSYALQASSAVPGLRKPVQIGNKLFVDGALAANVPVLQTKEMGADIIIAVDVDEKVTDVPLESFRKIGSVSRRTLLLQLARQDALQDAAADIVIHPDVDGIGLLSMKISDAHKAVAAGEKAALAALPAIKEKLSKAGVLTASTF